MQQFSLNIITKQNSKLEPPSYCKKQNSHVELPTHTNMMCCVAFLFFSFLVLCKSCPLFERIDSFKMHYDQRNACRTQQNPTFSFKFVPIPYPSAATYAHPSPPIA